MQIAGRQLVCWCSNDYLGLSTHPALASAAATSARTWGVGARASRLLAGTTSWHQRLEEALAAWFGAEAAIVYASGYLANLGTLQALLSRGDVVLVDRLAHASLLDAARSTGATFRVFHHNDPDHAADLLEQFTGRRRLIVTEGVFSMEGERAPLAELVSVAQSHGALVYLDDAHGAFVLGPTGRGTPEAAGVPHAALLYMGTLGKALGTQGGFVVGPASLINFLQNRARTFLYATALAVPVVAASVEALRVLAHDGQRRQTLETRCRQLWEGLGRLHATTLREPSHILPVVVGSTPRATALSQRLWDAGMWCPAIRPPSVPEGGARLRLSLTALHTASHVDDLLRALGEDDNARAVHHRD